MEDGASSRELLFEACRRDNTQLLSEVLATPALKTSAATADFLNDTVDSLGSGCLHVAAQYGSYEVLDMLLDQEGVEIDGQERRDGDTPLHKAVRYCNGLGREDWAEAGKAVLDILLDAGCDPRIRNKGKSKPLELLDPRNEVCRDALRQAEMTIIAGDDIIKDDEDDANDAGSESD